MVTTSPTPGTSGARRADRPEGASRRSDQGRYLLLAVGAVLALFATGGRFDVPLAAWLFSVFLLRFTRTTRPALGLPLVWLALTGSALSLMWQVALPMQLLYFLGAAGLGFVLAIPYIVDRLLGSRLGTVGRLGLFPAALVVCASLLGQFGPFGTMFGAFAVTQHEQLGLLQVLSLGGTYTVAFLIGTLATVTNHVWETRVSRQSVRVAVVYAAGVAVIVAGGQLRTALFPVPSSPTVRVAGINPTSASIDAAEHRLGESLTDLNAVSRVDPDRVRTAVAGLNAQLLADTRRAAEAGAKIVLWSENSARFLDMDESAFLSQAGVLARQFGIYLDVAANVYLPDAPYGRDETVLIGPDGGIMWTYQKRHPVPGMELYKPGDGPVPVVNTPYGRLANVICYDADFPALMHVNADIMLVPGGDWPELGRTHTQMEAMRAIENGYNLVRSDFDGSSQAFDYQGHMLSQQDTTTGDNSPWLSDIPTRGKTTIFRVTGEILAWLCLIFVLASIGMSFRRRTRLNVGVTTPVG